MKRLWWLVVLFVLLVIVLVDLLMMYFIPSKPLIPYFTKDVERVGLAKWTIAKFQPYYLWTYKKDGKVLIKTMYRNEKGQLVFADVQLSGQLDSVEMPNFKYRSNDGKLDIVSDPQNVGEKLRFGQRFGVVYLRNVDNREGEFYSGLMPYGVAETSTFCENMKEVCVLAKYTKSHAQELWELALGEKLTDGVVVPAMVIYEEIVK